VCSARQAATWIARRSVPSQAVPATTECSAPTGKTLPASPRRRAASAGRRSPCRGHPADAVADPGQSPQPPAGRVDEFGLAARPPEAEDRQHREKESAPAADLSRSRRRGTPLILAECVPLVGRVPNLGTLLGVLHTAGTHALVFSVYASAKMSARLTHRLHSAPQTPTAQTL